MQTVTARTVSAPTRAAVFLMYLVGGLAIFWLGANTFDMFPTNRNPVYAWGLTAALLAFAAVAQRVGPLRAYARVAGALFIASAANGVNLALGNFLRPLLPPVHGDMQFLAVDKLSQAIPIVATIVLLSVWSGDDLRGLFLTRGRLRQGLRFGLASFAGFAAVFAVIVVIQADSPVTQGLFASGVRPDVVLAAAPWILVFCFANAFMEELWFRGVALRKLVPLLGGTASIVVTALVFGVTHAAATYVTAVQALLFAAVVVALGVVNAAVMLKTESIWGSVLFHAGYDLLVILPLLVS
jgi:membrane protease YdiL (CAAX protease family)